LILVIKVVKFGVNIFLNKSSVIEVFLGNHITWKHWLGLWGFVCLIFFLFFNQFEYLFFFSWRISCLEVRRMFLNKNMLKIEYLDNKVFIAYFFFYFFFDLRGCPGQLARTTTNPMAHWTPCKPSGHVRHRGGDRHAHEDSNPGAAGGDKLLLPPGQDPQCS